MTDPITPDESSQRSGTIDQIRDLIFGPQKRLLEERIENLASELRLALDESQLRAQQLRDTLKGDVTAHKQTVEQAIQQLSGKVCEETARLEQAAQQVESKLTANLASAFGTLQESVTSLQREMAELRMAHRSELLQLKERITAEIETKAAALHDDKVSRHAMADLLHELALKLKGSNHVQEPGNAGSVPAEAPEQVPAAANAPELIPAATEAPEQVPVAAEQPEQIPVAAPPEFERPAELELPAAPAAEEITQAVAVTPGV